MLKKDKKKQRNPRSLKYQRTTFEERCKILQMRNSGATSSEISKVINKHVKTIQSVKRVERKCIYKEFEEAMIEYGYNVLIGLPNIMNQSQKDLRKLASQVTKTELESESSQFIHLIPLSKRNSKKRRIFSKIAEDIVDRIHHVSDLDEVNKLRNQENDTVDLLRSQFPQTSKLKADGEEQEDLSEIQSSGYSHLDQNLDLSSPILRFLIPNK